ncbi:MAG: Ig-like domain-containing protein [Gammaproteobacteria bacterium]|nr:Ig-like domain-containing protein [Gammaproteobacteria bacterium]MBU1480513.1 Ig-like domain-containing protein [Gammaproteobacteria bacterium]
MVTQTVAKMLRITVLLLGLAGCGGGGGSGGGSPAPNVVESIAVSPAYISTDTNTSQQLTATATYADASTANVTSSVTWASANSAVVSVSNTGLAAAGAVQSSVEISASMGAVSGKSHIAVTSPVATLTAVIVPVNQTIYTGKSWLPTTWANANFSNGTGQSPYTLVKWTVSGCTPANAASVNADGTIAANTPGSCTITASSGALTSAAKTLTISDPTLQSIVIIPAAPSVAAGGNMQMTAMGTYIDGSQKNITALLQWSTSNAAVVGVDNTTSKGRITGVSAGSVTITATPILPGGHPPVAAATTTVTVPGAPPAQASVNLSPIEDNTVMWSSLVGSRKTTVYSYEAMFTNPAVAVGCAWYYSLVLHQMDASCSEGKLKFNLATLAGKTIVSATLRLQASAASTLGIVPRTWIVRALATPWSGTTITWDNSRGLQYYTYSQSAHNPPTFIGQIIDIDQTDTVRNWVAGAYQNNGLELVLGDYSIPNMYDISLDQFEFHSSEDAGGRGPKLMVTYQ